MSWYLRVNKAISKFKLWGALVMLLVQPMLVYGQDFEWSVAPVIGLHKLNLKDLNDKAFKAPIIGQGTIRGEPGTPQEALSFEIPLGFENELDPIGWNSNMGLEFQWKQTDSIYLLLGVSTWEGDSLGRTTGELPIQGNVFDVVYDRRAKISYNEFYFGVKHIFHTVPEKYRFYVSVSLNEIFDIDYREEHAFSISDEGGELDDVKRIFIINGQLTGLSALNFSVGGEYFIKKNIAIAADVGYLLTEGDFQFTNATSKSDTQLGDDFSLSLPVSRTGNDTSDPLGYLPPDTPADANWTDATNNPFPGYSSMNVSFDGWKAAMRIIMYY